MRKKILIFIFISLYASQNTCQDLDCSICCINIDEFNAQCATDIIQCKLNPSKNLKQFCKILILLAFFFFGIPISIYLIDLLMIKRIGLLRLSLLEIIWNFFFLCSCFRKPAQKKVIKKNQTIFQYLPNKNQNILQQVQSLQIQLIYDLYTKMINLLQWNILDYKLAQQDYFIKSSLQDLDWSIRKQKIKDIIDQFKSNILCFQEVQDKKDIENMLDSSFNIIFHIKKSGQNAHGNLIAYNSVIFEELICEKLYFKDKNQQDMSQNFMYIQLKRKQDGKIIDLINTHLKSKKNNQEIRLFQMKQIVEYVQSKNLKNLIIAGDLNADEDEPCHSILQNTLQLDYVGKGILTTMKYTKGHEKMLMRKIDYVYYNPKVFNLIKENFLNKENKDLACPNTYMPSDHLPTNSIFKQSQNKFNNYFNIDLIQKRLLSQLILIMNTNNRFEILSEIDEGSFGIVMMAKNKQTQEIVAIKKIKKKYNNWEECMNLREISSLRKLKHPNIVKLKEVYKQDNELHLVFDYCSSNLLKYYSINFKQQNDQIPESIIQRIVYQTAKGLAYIHRKGYFHRDLKPENLLITDSQRVQIADFGLARQIRSSPPYTDYVSTRWYRAPEILLKSNNYNSPVDIFALGCIMAELYLQQPLFQGKSELDQLHKVCSVLGTPPKSWVEGYKLAGQLGFEFPQFPRIDLQKKLPNASPEAIQLIQKMLTFESQNRISASQMLQHPYFKQMRQDSASFSNLKSEKKNKTEDIFDNLAKKQFSNNFHFQTQRPNNPTRELLNLGGNNQNYNMFLEEKLSLKVAVQNNKDFQQQHSNKNIQSPEKLDQLLEEFEEENFDCQINKQNSKKYLNELSNKKLKDLEKEIKILEKERSEKKAQKGQLYDNEIKQQYKSPKNENKIEDQLEKILNSSPFQSNKKIMQKKSPRCMQGLLNDLKNVSVNHLQKSNKQRIKTKNDLSVKKINSFQQNEQFSSYLKGFQGFNKFGNLKFNQFSFLHQMCSINKRTNIKIYNKFYYKIYVNFLFWQKSSNKVSNYLNFKHFTQQIY